MKRMIVPCSWYFFIGYYCAMLLVSYRCIGLVWACFCCNAEITESVRLTYLTTAALLLMVLLLLMITRASHLAAVYVFSECRIVRIVPFRLPKKVSYDEIHFVKASCVISSNYTMRTEYLFLSSEFLDEKDLHHIAPPERNGVIVSIRISNDGCRKLCKIIPPRISALIMSEIQAFSMHCRRFKKRQRSKNK